MSISVGSATYHTTEECASCLMRIEKVMART
jgi:hypothetical protein